MITTIAVGNRRLLKLADKLEKVKEYSQSGLGAAPCAVMYHNRWEGRRVEQGSSEYFALKDIDEWGVLFNTDGCKSPRGVPAKTGKQAAAAIRRFVAKREKVLKAAAKKVKA